MRWHYDSTALLDTLDLPVAWFLADHDRSSPNEQTIAKLCSWKASGKPYELIVFPGADHGMAARGSHETRNPWADLAAGPGCDGGASSGTHGLI